MANENTTVTSGPFSLGKRDVVMAVIRTIIGSVLAQVYTAVQAAQSGLTFHIDWRMTILIGVGAGLSDIMKRFFDNPKVVVTNATPETVQAAKDSVQK